MFFLQHSQKAFSILIYFYCFHYSFIFVISHNYFVFTSTQLLLIISFISLGLPSLKLSFIFVYQNSKETYFKIANHDCSDLKLKFFCGDPHSNIV